MNKEQWDLAVDKIRSLNLNAGSLEVFNKLLERLNGLPPTYCLLDSTRDDVLITMQLPSLYLDICLPKKNTGNITWLYDDGSPSMDVAKANKLSPKFWHLLSKFVNSQDTGSQPEQVK